MSVAVQESPGDFPGPFPPARIPQDYWLWMFKREDFSSCFKHFNFSTQFSPSDYCPVLAQFLGQMEAAEGQERNMTFCTAKHRDIVQ